MTLILSRIGYQAVLQISDRLITVDHVQYDLEANKSIILVADDGVACVSYCGLAFLNGIPSDNFLAQSLTGEIDLYNGNIPNLGPCFNNKHRRLDNMIHAIHVALNSSFRNSLQQKRHYFGLSICGWRTRNGRPFPFILNFEKPERRNRLQIVETTKRHWWMEMAWLFSHVPNGYLSKKHITQLQAIGQIQHKPFDEFYFDWRDTMLSIIRDASNTTGLVGSDGMVVCIPRPENNLVFIEYMPSSARFLNTPFAGQLPASPSPWIVGNRRFVAPSIMAGTGDQEHQVGQFTIRFRLPKNDKGVMYMGVHPRPPVPGAKKNK